ncbi:MAG: hypothetical protein HOP27_18005 [Anaerolineales bacterium]|nr:hypothetical protein [Anaerolineales bacterium]
MEKNDKPSQNNILLLQILLGFAATVIVAYLGFRGVLVTVETPIHATQTAEAKLTSTAQIQFTVESTLAWQDTGVKISAGDNVQIEYLSGSWTTWADGHPSVGPTGNINISDPKNPNHPLPSAYPGVLIGKIEKSDEIQEIGMGILFIAKSSGNLYLQINDDNLSDNEGNIRVRISINP